MALPLLDINFTLADVLAPDQLESIEESHRSGIGRSIQTFLSRNGWRNSANDDSEVQLQQLRIELENANAANKKAQHLVADAQHQTSVQETQLKLVKADNDELHRRLNECTEREKFCAVKFAENESTLSKLHHDIRMSERERKNLYERNQQLAQKLHDAERRTNEVHARNIERENENGDLKQRLNRATSDLESEKRSRDAQVAERLQHERRNVDKQLRDQHTNELKALRTTIASMQAQAAAAQTKEEMLRQRIAAFEKVLDDNRKVKAQIDQQFVVLQDKFRAELNGKDMALANAERELRRMESELTTSRKQIDELRRDVDGSQQALHAQKVQYEELLQAERKQVRDLNTQLETMRVDLESNSRALSALQNMPPPSQSVNSSRVNDAAAAAGDESDALARAASSFAAEDEYMRVEEALRAQLRQLSPSEAGGETNRENVSGMFKLLTKTTLTLKQRDMELRYLRPALDELLAGAQEQLSQYVRLNTEFEAREQLVYQLKDQLFALENKNVSITAQLSDAEHVLDEFDEHVASIARNDALFQQLATLLRSVSELRGASSNNNAAVLQSVEDLRQQAERLRAVSLRYRSHYDEQLANQLNRNSNGDDENDDQQQHAENNSFGHHRRITSAASSSSTPQRDGNAAATTDKDSNNNGSAQLAVVEQERDTLRADLARLEQQIRRTRLERDAFRSAVIDPLVAEFVVSLCQSEKACVVFAKLVDSFDSMQNFAEIVRNLSITLTTSDSLAIAPFGSSAPSVELRQLREQLDTARKEHAAALDTLRRRTDTLQTELQQSGDEVFGLRNSEQLLKQRCAELDGFSNAFRTQVESLRSEKAAAMNKTNELTGTIVQLEERLRQSQQRQHEAEQQVRTVQQEAERHRSQVQETKAAEQRARMQLKALQTENEQSKQLVRTLRALQTETTQQRSNGIEFWEQQAVSLQERCEALNKTIVLKNGHYDALERSAHVKVDGLQHQIGALQRDVSAKEAALDGLQAELVRLRETAANNVLKTDADGARSSSASSDFKSLVENGTAQQPATNANELQQQPGSGGGSTSLIWENVKLKRQLSETSGALEAERKHVAELDTTLRELKKAFDADRAKLEQNLAEFRDQLDKKTAESDSTQQLHDNLRYKLTTLETSLQVKLDMLRRLTEEHAESLQRWTRERVELEQQVRFHQQSAATFEVALQTQHTLSEQLQQSIVPLSTECESLRQRAVQLQQQVNAATARMLQVEHEFNQREQVGQAERQVLSRRVDELSQQRANIGAGSSEMSPSAVMTRYAECERRLRLLEDAKFVVDLERASLRAQLDAHQTLTDALRAQLTEQEELLLRTSDITAAAAGGSAAVDAGAVGNHHSIIVRALSNSNIQLLGEQKRFLAMYTQLNQLATTRQQQLDAFRAELLIAQGRLGSLGEQLNTVQAERAAVEAKYSQLHAQHEQLQRLQLNEAKSAASAQSNAVAGVAEQLGEEARQQANDQVQRRVAELEAELTQLRTTLETNRRKMLEKDDKFKRLQDYAKKLKAGNDELKLQVTKLESQTATITAETQSSSTPAAAGGESTKNFTKNIALIRSEYEEQITQLKRQIDLLSETTSAQMQHANDVEGALSRAEARVRDLEQSLKAARDAVEERNLRLSLVETKLNRNTSSMQQQIERLQAENAALQQRLAAAAASVVSTPNEPARSLRAASDNVAGDSAQYRQRDAEDAAAAHASSASAAPPSTTGPLPQMAASGNQATGGSTTTPPAVAPSPNDTALREHSAIQQRTVSDHSAAAISAAAPSMQPSSAPATANPLASSSLFSVVRGSALLPLNSNNNSNQRASVAGGGASAPAVETGQQQQPLQEPSQSGIGFSGNGRGRASVDMQQPFGAGRGTKRNALTAAADDAAGGNDADSVVAAEPAQRRRMDVEPDESTAVVGQQREASPGSAMMPPSGGGSASADDVASTTDEAATANRAAMVSASMITAAGSSSKRPRVIPTAPPMPTQQQHMSEHASVGSPTSVSSTSGGSSTLVRQVAPSFVSLSSIASAEHHYFPTHHQQQQQHPVQQQQQMPSSSSGSFPTTNVDGAGTPTANVAAAAAAAAAALNNSVLRIRRPRQAPFSAAATSAVRGNAAAQQQQQVLTAPSSSSASSSSGGSRTAAGKFSPQNAASSPVAASSAVASPPPPAAALVVNEPHLESLDTSASPGQPMSAPPVDSAAAASSGDSAAVAPTSSNGAVGGDHNSESVVNRPSPGFPVTTTTSGQNNATASVLFADQPAASTGSGGKSGGGFFRAAAHTSSQPPMPPAAGAALESDDDDIEILEDSHAQPAAAQQQHVVSQSSDGSHYGGNDDNDGGDDENADDEDDEDETDNDDDEYDEEDEDENDAEGPEEDEEGEDDDDEGQPGDGDGAVMHGEIVADDGDGQQQADDGDVGGGEQDENGKYDDGEVEEAELGLYEEGEEADGEGDHEDDELVEQGFDEGNDDDEGDVMMGHFALPPPAHGGDVGDNNNNNAPPLLPSVQPSALLPSQGAVLPSSSSYSGMPASSNNNADNNDMVIGGGSDADEAIGAVDGEAEDDGDVVLEDAFFQ